MTPADRAQAIAEQARSIAKTLVDAVIREVNHREDSASILRVYLDENRITAIIAAALGEDAPMNEQIRALLLELAGFLTVHASGNERDELLEKIGSAIVGEDAQPPTAQQATPQDPRSTADLADELERLSKVDGWHWSDGRYVQPGVKLTLALTAERLLELEQQLFEANLELDLTEGPDKEP